MQDISFFFFFLFVHRDRNLHAEIWIFGFDRQWRFCRNTTESRVIRAHGSRFSRTRHLVKPRYKAFIIRVNHIRYTNLTRSIERQNKRRGVKREEEKETERKKETRTRTHTQTQREREREKESCYFRSIENELATKWVIPSRWFSPPLYYERNAGRISL